MNNPPDDLASRLDDLKMVDTNKTAIPSHVLDRVCRHLRLNHAQGALLNVLLTSRSSYEIAAPHLYRDVYITHDGIDSLLSGLQEDANHGPKSSFPPSSYPWDPLEPSERGERKNDAEAYLERIVGGKVKPDLGIFGRIGLDNYPNESSHARKLALFHRATRIIALSLLDEEKMLRFAWLAATATKLLFPSVDTVILPDCHHDLLATISARKLQNVICQAACPSSVCLWPILVTVDYDSVLSDPPLIGACKNVPVMGFNPGRVARFHHHGIGLDDVQPMLGAANRFDFSFDPVHALEKNELSFVEMASERLGQARHLLCETLRLGHLGTTSIDLIDFGSLVFDDTPAVMGIQGRVAFETAIQWLVDLGTFDLDQLLTALAIVRLRSRGEVEDCEGCSDLPLAYNPTAITLSQGDSYKSSSAEVSGSV